MGPVVRVCLKPEQLGEMFGATPCPATALAFEAAVDTHFDVLFNRSAARAYRGQLATERAAQPRWNSMPVVDPITIAQDVTKEGVKFRWARLAVWTGA